MLLLTGAMDLGLIDRRAFPSGMRLWEWQAPDGWRHRRADWPQQTGTTPRGSLLFATGRGDFIEKYLEPLAEWHGRGWNVASFDWRGQGKSRGDIVGGHLESFDPLLDDFEALVADWMASTPGPHVIVGHSMGGHMTLRLLIERPAAVAAAVLIAPMIAVNPAPFGPRAARVLTWVASRIGFSRRPMWKVPLGRAPAGSKRQQVLTNCLERYEDERFWWEVEPSYAPHAPSFGWLDAGMRSGRAFTARKLAKVDVPILLLAAVKDRLVSLDAIHRTAEQLPRAEIALYDECAHEILREKDETRLAALARIDAFLNENAR